MYINDYKLAAVGIDFYNHSKPCFLLATSSIIALTFTSHYSPCVARLALTAVWETSLQNSEITINLFHVFYLPAVRTDDHVYARVSYRIFGSCGWKLLLLVMQLK